MKNFLDFDLLILLDLDRYFDAFTLSLNYENLNNFLELLLS